MGIRFYCPKGHKLNVKEFLAGKKALCPYCGLKVLVPTESTRPSSKRQKGEAAPPTAAMSHAPTSDASDVLAMPAPSTSGEGSSIIISGAAHAANETPSGVGDSPSNLNDFLDRLNASPDDSGDYRMASDAPAIAAQDDASAASLSSFLDAAGSGAPAADPSPVADQSDVLSAKPEVSTETLNAADDPLNDDENARWYVRSKSGSQLGPATGSIMRRWLAKGRIKADSLVWREGWLDWEQAGKIFPQFAGGLSKPNLGDLLAEEPLDDGEEDDDDALLAQHAGNPRKVVAITLTILIVALVAAFIAVLVVNL